MLRLQILGTLGKDCTVKTLDGGQTVTNFSIVHSEKYKDKNGEQKLISYWVECARWSDKTKIADFLKKGAVVLVEGLPTVGTYTSQDGKAVAKQMLKVSSIQIAKFAPNEDSNTPAASTGSEPRKSWNEAERHINNAIPNDQDIDDLPF